MIKFHPCEAFSTCEIYNVPLRTVLIATNKDIDWYHGYEGKPLRAMVTRVNISTLWSRGRRLTGIIDLWSDNNS